MKNLFITLLLFLASLASITTFAETKQNGCAFNEIKLLNGDSVTYVESKDDYGNHHSFYWPKAPLNKEYNDRSKAIQACEEIGLSLPTVLEFQALKNCFEHEKEYKTPTDKGIDEFRKTFPLLADRVYWSSTELSGEFDYSHHGEYTWIFAPTHKREYISLSENYVFGQHEFRSDQHTKGAFLDPGLNVLCVGHDFVQ